MTSESYHEPVELLSEATKDMHRAIVSLMEELEAIDWYQQRAEVSTDDALREVLIHNKNEEIEHAMMNLEWIRRNSREFDEKARTYLFKSGSILEAEEATKTGNGSTGNDPGDESAKEPSAAPSGNANKGQRGRTPASGGSLGIGSLKGAK